MKNRIGAGVMAAAIMGSLAAPVAAMSPQEMGKAMEEAMTKSWEAVKPSLVVVVVYAKTQTQQGMQDTQVLLNGLVVANGYALIPDPGSAKQVKKLKAWQDGQEGSAELVGREESFGLALIKIPEGRGTPVKFRPAQARVGQMGTLVFMDAKERDFGPVMANIQIMRKWKNDGGVQLQPPMNMNIGYGAALMDLDGQLIGYQSPQRLWLCTSEFWTAVEDLLSRRFKPITDEDPSKGKSWLGVTFSQLSEPFAESKGLKESKGVRIHKVVSGSPAEKAGLKSGDVLLGMDGKPFEQEGAATMSEAQRRIQRLKPGKEVELAVWRAGTNQSVKCQLAERPTARTMLLEDLGMKLEELTDWQKDLMRLQGVDGALVSQVTRGGPAQYAGITTQENRSPMTVVMTEFNGKKLSKWEDVQEAVSAAREGKMEKVLVKGVRGGSLSEFMTVINLKIGAKKTGGAGDDEEPAGGEED